MKKLTATINSLPLEVDFMIIEWLPLKDALNMAKALLIPEQVAVQYFACEKEDTDKDVEDYFKDLQPSSFKFLLKNTSFQIVADSDDKIWAAFKTLDLDFVKKFLEQVKPDLNEALIVAARIGFTDVVILLLSDYGVDPSARDNQALIDAAGRGHLEIVKLLLSDDRVDPSAEDNRALIIASHKGRLEIVKLLLLDTRVDPSAQDNAALRLASEEGYLDIVKLLLSDSRVDPSAWDNQALRLASQEGHLEIVKLMLSDDRVDPSVLDNRDLISAALVAHSEILEKVRHYILTFRFDS